MTESIQRDEDRYQLQTYAKLPIAITHAPGYMFVSDLREEQLRMFSESVR